MKKSYPFSVSILALMTLVVVPLALVLLGLGWRAAMSLERTNIEQRMVGLADAVDGFLSDGVRVVVAAGQTLAEAPSFGRQAGAAADGERQRQLIGVLDRHPMAGAVYAGYDDGHFVYAGRIDLLTADQRHTFGIVADDRMIVRTIDGDGTARRESWQLGRADGSLGPPQTRPTSYDPRLQPWYRAALAKHGPALTEPDRFARSGTSDISLGTPIPGGGAIGFDFDLDAVSQLLTARKFSPNSLIMIATTAGVVFGESADCASDDPRCLPDHAKNHDAIRREIMGEMGHVERRRERDMDFGGNAYKLILDPLPPLFGERFVVGIAVPLIQLEGGSRILLQRSVMIAAIALALAALAVFLVSRFLSRSIARIAVKTDRIRNLDFSDREPVVSRIREIVRLSSAVERMREGLEVFGRYVSKDLVEQIMRAPESAGVGGVRRDITVMFTDIEGFSLISETLAPELLTSRLSRYFQALGDAIVGNKGMIDKYIGDSIMAFWNAPEADDRHVANACRAALQAAAAGRRLADKWTTRGRSRFHTRFGLHTGPTVVGNVGARDRINYTLVGAVANQASRIEGLNKAYGTEILASGDVARLTSDEFVWRHIDRVVPAGTTEALDVHEPLAECSEAATAMHAAFLASWNAGRLAYGHGNFSKAIAGFEAAAALRPQDGPSRTMIARCAEFLRDGVPAGWDGAWRFDKK
jgi:adenylate cyclase